jgi:hypothetical protein
MLGRDTRLYTFNNQLFQYGALLIATLVDREDNK